jgi:hypothetical protein
MSLSQRFGRLARGWQKKGKFPCIDNLLSNSAYAELMHLAELELASFIGAVTELFGPEARSAQRLAA